MKKASFLQPLLILAVISSTTAKALSIEIISKNQSVTAFDVSPPTSPKSIGQVTIDAFKSHQITFEGSDAGIISIQGQGSDLEVISDKVMKAWGWCYSIDDQIINQMPDKVTLNSDVGVLKWFYAYALYDSGTWTGYCIQDK